MCTYSLDVCQPIPTPALVTNRRRPLERAELAELIRVCGLGDDEDHWTKASGALAQVCDFGLHGDPVAGPNRFEIPSRSRRRAPGKITHLSLTSGIAAESDRPKVGGAIIPPKRALRASCSLLNSGLASPIASAKRRIASRSTSSVRASPTLPICFSASSVTYLFATYLHSAPVTCASRPSFILGRL